MGTNNNLQRNIVVIVALVLIIGALFLTLLIQNKSSQTGQPSLISKLTGSGQQAQPDKPQPLSIASINPSSKQVDLSDRVKLIFNKPVSASNFFLTVSPSMAIDISQGDDKTIIITPHGVWTDGTTYQFKVLGNTLANDSTTLGGDYLFNIQAKLDYVPIEVGADSPASSSAQ